jgi:hypothetical protein
VPQESTWDIWVAITQSVHGLIEKWLNTIDMFIL